MKALTKLTIAALLLASIIPGCEKDPLQPDKNALRISKIADNPGMQDPLWTFEYNDKGLVEEIFVLDRHSEQDPIIYSASIIYNDDNLPVEIGDIDINWEENSFTILYPESYDMPDETFMFDGNGKITEQSYNLGDSRRGYEARWEGDEAEIYYMRDGTEEWAQTRKLTQNPHPLSSINIAVVYLSDLSWIYDECEIFFQNEYCLAYLTSVDEGSADYTYEFNEDGYPTELEIYETTEKDTYKFYFEYEED